MQVLFLSKPGIDLAAELSGSETSRDALRFYTPVPTPCGVLVHAATLGSGLALASELRWYIRRYMRDVLFSHEYSGYLTHRLARSIYYERAPLPTPPWPWAAFYSFLEGRIVNVSASSEKAGSSTREKAGSSTRPGRPLPLGDIRTIEVWHTRDEYNRLFPGEDVQTCQEEGGTEGGDEREPEWRGEKGSE